MAVSGAEHKEPREELHFVSVIKAINDIQEEGGSRRISMDTKRGRE